MLTEWVNQGRRSTIISAVRPVVSKSDRLCQSSLGFGLRIVQGGYVHERYFELTINVEQSIASRVGNAGYSASADSVNVSAKVNRLRGRLERQSRLAQQHNK